MPQLIYLLVCLTLLCTGCTHLSVIREKIDQKSLASYHVRTPDPRLSHPSIGVQLIVEWAVPGKWLKQNPTLLLSVVYGDYSQEKIVHSIKSRAGTFVYRLVDAEFEQKKGILTYKVDVVGSNGEVLGEWKHQMWFEVIDLDEKRGACESTEDASKMSDSVSSQPRQGSVIETPDSKGAESESD